LRWRVRAHTNITVLGNNKGAFLSWDILLLSPCYRAIIMEDNELNLTLKRQLEALLTTLSSISASQQPGNAVYYLNRISQYVVNRGVDCPMVAGIWLEEDFDELTENTIGSDKARELFALIDRRHDAEIGINWDVLNAALDSD